MTTNWDDRTPIEDVLAHGVDDWLDAGMIYQIARRAGLDDLAATRAVAIGLIGEALVGGFAVAGEVTDNGFRSWEMTPDVALGRVVEEWLAYGTDPPSPGAIFWLAVTRKGEELGTEGLRREGSAS